MKRLRILVFLHLILPFLATGQAKEFFFRSDGHLAAVELNHGESLRYRKSDGTDFQLRLIRTSARSVFSFEDSLNPWRSGRIFTMECDVEINGQPMHLMRLVSVQQSFYEPWHINGVTLFFDAVRCINAFIQDNHGGALRNQDATFPVRDARFAFMEYGGKMADEEPGPWFPVKENRFRIEDSYDGGDVWLGAFKKDEAHSGLDINVPNNTPLWAPIGFENQFYFQSLQNGDNNNRWKGIRTWKNGTRWILRSHHMTELHVPEGKPVLKGTPYGEIGGTHYGGHPHAHFYFIWQKDSLEIKLDPWILFWKIFENRRSQAGEIRAVMNRLKPCRTGETLVLSSAGSRAGRGGGPLRCFWSLSDGRRFEGKDCRPELVQPGMLGISLLVTDGCDSSSVTQWISVAKGKNPGPWFTVLPQDSLDLVTRKPEETDLYGFPDYDRRFATQFFFRKNPVTAFTEKVFRLAGNPGDSNRISVSTLYQDRKDWLSATLEGNFLKVRLLPENLDKALGTYQAQVRVRLATGEEQILPVQASAPDHRQRPPDRVEMDDEEALLYPSRFYWVRNGYEHSFLKGFKGSFRIWAGGDSLTGTARFQPDLKAGKYRVSLPENVLNRSGFGFEKAAGWKIRIMARNGQYSMDWQSGDPLTLGEFDFAEGKQGWVEFSTSHKTGLFCIDGLIFERLGD